MAVAVAAGKQVATALALALAMVGAVSLDDDLYSPRTSSSISPRTSSVV
jgi:hypothetical protein